MENNDKRKVDVAIQSFRKPESLIYTLFSLHRYCGEHVDTIWINDDCSGGDVLELYRDPRLQEALAPIKLRVRENVKPSGYNVTLMTRDAIRRHKPIQRLQLFGYALMKRLSFHSTSDDVRYQWAIDGTDKPFLFVVHDDIKFFADVLGVYLDDMRSDDNLAIVGDLGYERLCPFGPCGEKCSPERILGGDYPCPTWPVTGCRSPLHRVLGRMRRDCRVNEWCCLIDVGKSREIYDKFGVFFGNYEAGGDVGTYWLDCAMKLGYTFDDPIPKPAERLKYYLHWWQGHEGHEVWVDYGRGRQTYEGDRICSMIESEFKYAVRK